MSFFKLNICLKWLSNACTLRQASALQTSNNKTHMAPEDTHMSVLRTSKHSSFHQRAHNRSCMRHRWGGQREARTCAIEPVWVPKDNSYASGSHTEPEWRMFSLLSLGLDGAEEGVNHGDKLKTILTFTGQQLKKAPSLNIRILNIDRRASAVHGRSTTSFSFLSLILLF